MGVNVNFTTQWQTFEKEFIITKEQAGTADNKQMQTIAWNLAVLKEANTYYFDDIEFSIQQKAEGIPLTPEEKKEVLTHPYLKEKIEWGLVPYVQAMLLARYLRGDLDGYPVFLWK